MFSKSKKAQVEILGLVIIVVLISVGILIAILVFTRPISKELYYEQESLLAANFLNTLLKSDASCKGMSISEVIQHCATLDVGWNGAVLCEDGSNSCRHTKALIDELTKKIFTSQRKKFFFSIDSDNVALSSFVFGGRCKGEFESKTRPLIVFGGPTIYVKLDICH